MTLIITKYDVPENMVKAGRKAFRWGGVIAAYQAMRVLDPDFVKGEDLTILQKALEAGWRVQRRNGVAEMYCVMRRSIQAEGSLDFTRGA
jgi:hypothetical protein